MNLKFGKLIECIAITPNFNISWIQVTKGTIYYVQIAWLRWYISLIINKKSA